MNPVDVLDIGREEVYVLLKVTSPIMLVAMGVGLIIALFQALTQIQEMTLTFVPKIIATFLCLILVLPFIGVTLGGFATDIFQQIARI